MSEDGSSWQPQTIYGVAPMNGVAFGNGIFVAIADLPEPTVFTSRDGMTWVSQGVPISLCNRLYFDGTRFIAQYDGSAFRYSSIDGQSWTRHSFSEPIAPKAASGKRAMATADLKWSTDGNFWIQAAPPTTSGLLRDVAYGNGSFVVVGGAGVVIQSPEAPALAMESSTTLGIRIDAAQGVASAVLQTSTNLLDWTDLTSAALTNGSSVYIPIPEPPLVRKFFRAVSP